MVPEENNDRACSEKHFRNSTWKKNIIEIAHFECTKMNMNTIEKINAQTKYASGLNIKKVGRPCVSHP